MARKTAKKTGPQNWGPVQSFYFNSIPELIEETERQAPTATGSKLTYLGFYTDSSNPERTDWSGGIATATEYKEIIKTGYLPAVKDLEAMETGTGNRQELTPSLTGQFWDVAAYLEGRPECMGDFAETEINQYLTIKIEIGVPYNMGARQLLEKVKVIFDSIRQTEANGTRVRVSMFANVKATKTNQKFNFEVLIKDYENSLIPALHGLFLGHLATIRAIAYSFLSLHSKQDSIGSKDIQALKPEPGVKIIHLSDDIWKIKKDLQN